MALTGQWVSEKIFVYYGNIHGHGHEVINVFSCSAQLRLKFILFKNVKMQTFVDILTFISRKIYRFWRSKPKISVYLSYFVIYEQFK